jgi:hypothetical protein
MRVIMPSAEMNDRRDKTCVTPANEQTRKRKTPNSSEAGMN